MGLSLFERWLISKFGILDILNFGCSEFRTYKLILTCYQFLFTALKDLVRWTFLYLNVG